SRLTVDHSEVQRLVNMGVITPEEALTHPKRHVISQYMGMSPDEVRLSVGVTDLMRLQPGDWYLLCSDGLTDMLTDSQIR
ncbi:MAG: serine/threonine-protein phosphatase, partial [Clostridia bacterium]|nr:serine/threonine-protein phosphatase [Clostridia bacterium]